jgi:hypothetical protein
MLWSEDHVWITFSKTQWEKYDKGFYLLKNSCRENRRYDIEYVLKTTLKTLVEKLGDMLVLILPN